MTLLLMHYQSAFSDLLFVIHYRFLSPPLFNAAIAKLNMRLVHFDPSHLRIRLLLDRCPHDPRIEMLRFRLSGSSIRILPRFDGSELIKRKIRRHGLQSKRSLSLT